MVKLAFILLCAVALGFTVFAVVNARSQLQAMTRIHQSSAASIARGLIAGVRSAMLTGNGMAVRSLLDDAKQRIAHARIRVYDPAGALVFEAKNDRAAGAATPPEVLEAIRAGEAQRSTAGADVLPIPNETRCRRCHETGELRGVLALSTVGAKRPIAPAAKGREVISEVVEAGFVQIMTAQQSGSLDDFFAELATAGAGSAGSGITRVAVVDADGDTSFGDEATWPGTGDELKAALRQPGPTERAAGDSVVRVVPLQNEPRCQGCHDADEQLRGGLLVSYAPRETLQTALVQSVRTSLQHVMLSGLGRLVAGFLDRAAATGALSELVVYDPKGGVYHAPLQPVRPPDWVAEALDSRQVVQRTNDAADTSTFTYVEPMPNEQACQRCHGTDKALRGAIEVVLDTSEANREQRAMMNRSAVYAGLTIILVILVLYFGLRLTVLSPVREIGTAAERVQQGDLEVSIPIDSADEIGRLAGRFNDMVGGLRKKLELSKFVSQATVANVDKVDGTVSRGGERRRHDPVLGHPRLHGV